MIVFSNGIPVLLNDGLHIWNDSLATTQGVVTSFNNWLTDTGAGVDTSPDAVYASQPAVRTVVSFLANNVAQVSAHSFQMAGDGDRARTRATPLARLLKNPAPTQTEFEYRVAQVTDICLWDRFLALIIRTGQESWELRRVPPRHWGFIRDGSDRPIGVTFGEDETMTLERTVWVDGYPSTARSPMEVLKDVLTEEGESAASRRDLWKNRARVDQWISRAPSDVSGDWTPDARDNFKTSMAAYRAGGARSGMIPVLEDGMQLNEVNRLSPVDAQQLEFRKLSKREVAAFYGVDSSLVGGDGATYSNVTAYREQLYRDTLGHWFARLSQVDNARLVPVVAADTGEFCEFNVGEKLRLAFDQQADIYARAAGAPHMTRNEVRQLQNLPAIEGADDLLIPLNVGTDLDLERT